MSDDSQYAAEILADYPRLLTENYCIIASSALLWFDFALTFPTECRRIWNRKFTGATVVYLLTRYIAVVERIFFVLEVLVWRSTDQVCVSLCGGITHTDDVLLFLNYLAFSAFTALRAYGVWGRSWTPLLLVLPLSLVKPILGIYEAAHYVPVQAGPPFGCVYIYNLPHVDASLTKYLSSNRLIVSITSRATTIAADVVIIALTWIKTLSINRGAYKMGMRTPVTTLLLRDGDVKPAPHRILLAIQLVSIISTQVSYCYMRLTIWLVWPYFDQVFTVIFLSRFMLDLRGLYFSESEKRDPEITTTTLLWSDIRFQHVSVDVVGNMGATLTTTLAPSVPSTSAPDPDELEKAPPVSVLDPFVVGDPYEWDDEPPEYCEDPFMAGMVTSEKPPPRIEVSEAGETDVRPTEEQSLGNIQVSTCYA
ncbi:hypothetical protein C8Q79DRAFT_912048 [Trametes meyenii]|nr:hypothetical protein C8Q79DRAFT_912048 [Trametes meyenii]